MILNSTTRKLQAVLTGAAAATQPNCTVVYHDVLSSEKSDFSEYLKAVQFAATNDTTEVDICDAPSDVGVVRVIDYLSVYNGDTGSLTVKIMIDDNTTNRTQVAVTLLTTESLTFTPDNGWSIQT